ncbi:abortive infection family protein [Neisseria zoodegmatis]|uniref:Abortive phage resistance protein n=1 Tax=Neisseria zoodegmatis TaxID=326523 RepID=A0AB38DPU8_9NEIS|nr:abortive infection family protein [Neisseria zoodegmatis]OSI09583.1 abortive phage resistance protein [Neisseria zoodegmatis]SNU79363.1 Uncharacterised protein [Neisseria zoodegmatis]
MDDLLIHVESLKNLLISRATGGQESNQEYVKLRHLIISNSKVNGLVPQFIQTCRSLDQFWQFIKYKYETYRERRTFIWEEFEPLFNFLEQRTIPSDEMITSIVKTIDAEYVQDAWSKALERRTTDPEGAITSARTLIESVCKHILDEAEASYEDNLDLPKLYKKTAHLLNLSPSQHTEEVFKQILGGCTSVIEGLGTMRNRLSDAHGKGKVGSKPAPRHAELAVNLSGAFASYLLATWEAYK